MSNYNRNRGGFNNQNRGNYSSYGNNQRRGAVENLIVAGQKIHEVEGEILCNGGDPQLIPHIGAPIYLENKTCVGQVDEVLGNIRQFMFTVKLSDGYNKSTFPKEQSFYIESHRTMPLERFTKPLEAGPKEKKSKDKGQGGKGGNMSRGGNNRNRGNGPGGRFNGNNQRMNDRRGGPKRSYGNNQRGQSFRGR